MFAGKIAATTAGTDVTTDAIIGMTAAIAGMTVAMTATTVVTIAATKSGDN